MARPARERDRTSAVDQWRPGRERGFADRTTRSSMIWVIRTRVGMVLARARSHEEDDRHVCARCWAIRRLKRFVRWAANARSCTFCHRRAPVDFAAP